MSKKTAADLFDRLFDAIDGVRSGDTTIEQAKAISELSQVAVNLAKVGVEHARITDRGESEFLAPPPAELPNGITSIVQHRLK